jgi:hypothetical protein
MLWALSAICFTLFMRSSLNYQVYKSTNLRYTVHVLIKSVKWHQYLIRQNWCITAYSLQRVMNIFNPILHTVWWENYALTDFAKLYGKILFIWKNHFCINFKTSKFFLPFGSEFWYCLETLPVLKKQRQSRVDWETIKTCKSSIPIRACKIGLKKRTCWHFLDSNCSTRQRGRYTRIHSVCWHKM